MGAPGGRLGGGGLDGRGRFGGGGRGEGGPGGRFGGGEMPGMGPMGPMQQPGAMDTDMGESTFVQQNVAMDIDQTNIQQNNLQQVHIEATQNQFQQINVGVDPAVAVQLQYEAREAEHRARCAEIASHLNKTSFETELARITALHEAETARANAAQEAGARMTEALIHQGRAAVAAASEDASNARAQAAAATGEAPLNLGNSDG